jgi:hypothetical protein
MDPVEKELRDLPWRKPSRELRDRLFAAHEEETIIRVVPHNWVPWAWAAAFLIAAGISIPLFWSGPDAPTAVNHVPMLTANTQPIEIASSQSFFDFSSGPDDAWAGHLTLTIETN